MAYRFERFGLDVMILKIQAKPTIVVYSIRNYESIGNANTLWLLKLQSRAWLLLKALVSFISATMCSFLVFI